VQVWTSPLPRISSESSIEDETTWASIRRAINGLIMVSPILTENSRQGSFENRKSGVWGDKPPRFRVF
jgi:hypothetical protein